jgi:DNA polymerase II small subunit/DNA polymerase delta subunit B
VKDGDGEGQANSRAGCSITDFQPRFRHKPSEKKETVMVSEKPPGMLR